MEKILPSRKNKSLDLISLLLRSNEKVLLAIKQKDLNKLDLEINNRQNIVEEINRRNVSSSKKITSRAKSEYDQIVNELKKLICETKKEIKTIKTAKNLTKKYQLGMTSK